MTSTKSAEVISPLRRRMIEDMSIRKFSDKTARLYPPHRNLCQVSGPLAGHRDCRGPASVSGASDGNGGSRDLVKNVRLAPQMPSIEGKLN
jgi:hypothetical protein